jgi:Family of unknown function (DUF6056)
MARVALATLGAALAVPLLVFAAIGGFSRYTADDFCWAGTLRIEGFVNAQVLYYTVYSPRYAFTFLVTLLESAGPAVVPALPAAAIVVWLGTATWTFKQYGIATTRALLIAEVGVFATLQTAPDLPQSLYWQTGMLTYVLPLILATFLLGWIRRGMRRWWALAISGVVTFIAGGLSETYLIPQNVALTLALLAAFTLARPAPGRSTTVVHLSAALAGGVLALITIVAAPATANRVGGTPADVWLAMSAAIATALFQVLRLVRYFGLIILLCLVVPAIVGACAARVDRRWLPIVIAITAITLPFCYFPSFYAQNGNPPARSLIVPGAMLIGVLMYAGFALQPLARRIPQTTAAVVTLSITLVPLGFAVLALPQITAAAQYATIFDAEDQQIRASRDAGEADLTVPPLPANLGEDFITSDRRNFLNNCVARYYGVRSIATP